MKQGALIIDCSTIDVESVKQAHALAAKQGVGSVDAPVSGGTGRQGRDADLHVRRRRECLRRQSPSWRTWARRSCIAVGRCGQGVKICNNMVLGGSMTALGEAFGSPKAWAVASGGVRRGVDFVRAVLGLTSDCPVPGRPTFPAMTTTSRACDRTHGEGPHLGAGCGKGGRRGDAARQASAEALQGVEPPVTAGSISGILQT